MKIHLWIVCGFMAMAATAAQCDTVRSCVINRNEMPIRNQILNPACKLQVTYQFKPEMNVLLCLSNSLKNAGKITWPYQGKEQTSDLPVVLAKNGKDASTLIDEKGKFSIENNQQKQLVVSCQFSHGVASSINIRELIKSSIQTADARCARNEYLA